MACYKCNVCSLCFLRPSIKSDEKRIREEEMRGLLLDARLEAHDNW